MNFKKNGEMKSSEIDEGSFTECPFCFLYLDLHFTDKACACGAVLYFKMNFKKRVKEID